MNKYADSCLDIIENKLAYWGLVLKFKVVERNGILKYFPIIERLDGTSNKFIEKDGIIFKIDCGVKNNALYFTISEIENYRLKNFESFTKYLNQLNLIKDVIDGCNELSVNVPVYVGIGSISDIVRSSEIFV